MAEMRQDRLAFDRAATARRIDEDGHMHVSDVPISKANVCPYYGREIPGWDEMSPKLNPDRVYQLLRSPDALEEAAATFNGKPVLKLHRPQTSDDHAHEIHVGSIANVYWDPPYLKAGNFTVLDGESIAGIESKQQREVSASYRYDPVMGGGVHEGVKYDGRMTNIRANHVALVERGRAGSDVFVSDSAPPAAHVGTASPTPPLKKETAAMAKTASAPASRKAVLAHGALTSYLRSKLAADASIDTKALLKGVTAKNWQASKPKIVAGLTKAAEGKLAQDADLDDAPEMLDQLDDIKDDLQDVVEALEQTVSGTDPETPATDTDDDMVERLKKVLTTMGMSDDDIAKVVAAMSPEVDAPVAAEDDKTAKVATAADAALKAAKVAVIATQAPVAGLDAKSMKVALDAAITLERARTASAVAAATAAARADTVSHMNAIRDAERAVRPYVGELAVAMDSAEAVYGFVLESRGVDLTDVPPAAYRAMVGMLPTAIAATAAAIPAKARVAQDAALATNRSAMFPNAGRLSN